MTRYLYYKDESDPKKGWKIKIKMNWCGEIHDPCKTLIKASAHEDPENEKVWYLIGDCCHVPHSPEEEEAAHHGDEEVAAPEVALSPIVHQSLVKNEVEKHIAAEAAPPVIITEQSEIAQETQENYNTHQNLLHTDVQDINEKPLSIQKDIQQSFENDDQLNSSNLEIKKDL